MLDYAIIENAITGITIGNPDEDTLADLTLKHSIIRHTSQMGLAAYSSDVVAENLLIMNSGSSNLVNAAGASITITIVPLLILPTSFTLPIQSLFLPINLSFLIKVKLVSIYI